MLKKRFLCRESDQTLKKLSREGGVSICGDTQKLTGQTSAICSSGPYLSRCPTSAITWFCDLIKHPCFYLHKRELPFCCRSTFPIGSLSSTCSQLWKLCGGFAGDCAVAWRKLVSQSVQLLAFPTSFHDAHNYSLHFLMGRFSTEERLLPVLILGKSCPHRDSSVVYLWYWSNHLQYKACLQSVHRL